MRRNMLKQFLLFSKPIKIHNHIFDFFCLLWVSKEFRNYVSYKINFFFHSFETPIAIQDSNKSKQIELGSICHRCKQLVSEMDQINKT